MVIDTAELWAVECAACDDSGWLVKLCEGTRDVICNRRRKHQAHDFAVPCPCRSMNVRYQEKQGSYVRTA